MENNVTQNVPKDAIQMFQIAKRRMVNAKNVYRYIMEKNAKKNQM